MRRCSTLIFLVVVLSLTLSAFAQQTDIRQFVIYGGYNYLNTPSLNLVQHGFDGDLGYNYKPWLSLGFDFSYSSGASNLYPNMLNAATQAKLAPFLPLLPPNFSVPYGSTTYTYEGGIQFNYRHFKKVTFFARPALGALHAKFNTTSTDPLTNMIVMGLLNGQLATADTVPFYGFGGGASWEITPNFGLRFAADFAHYNFFSAALNGGRNTVRLTVGPKFSFGKNIVK